MALASLKASSDTVCAITFGCFCHCPSHFTVEVSDLPVSAEPLLPAPCVLLMTQKAAVRVPMGLQSLCSRRRTAGSQWKAQPCPSTGGERTQWKLTSRPCIQGFCKDLLEVADILEKATQSVPKEEIRDDNPHLKNLYEGLLMTEAQIQKVFTKHGLLRLDPLGAKFDPYEHEALFHTPVEGKEPGTVALVNKVGYKLHGRTLRPALVGVVKEA